MFSKKWLVIVLFLFSLVGCSSPEQIAPKSELQRDKCTAPNLFELTVVAETDERVEIRFTCNAWGDNEEIFSDEYHSYDVNNIKVALREVENSITDNLTVVSSDTGEIRQIFHGNMAGTVHFFYDDYNE